MTTNEADKLKVIEALQEAEEEAMTGVYKKETTLDNIFLDILGIKIRKKDEDNE